MVKLKREKTPEMEKQQKNYNGEEKMWIEGASGERDGSIRAMQHTQKPSDIVLPLLFNSCTICAKPAVAFDLYL